MMLTNRFAYTVGKLKPDEEPDMVRYLVNVVSAVDSPIRSRDTAMLTVRFADQGAEDRNHDFALDMVRNLAAEIVGDIDSTSR